MRCKTSSWGRWDRHGRSRVELFRLQASQNTALSPDMSSPWTYSRKDCATLGLPEMLRSRKMKSVSFSDLGYGGVGCAMDRGAGRGGVCVRTGVKRED